VTSESFRVFAGPAASEGSVSSRWTLGKDRRSSMNRWVTKFNWFYDRVAAGSLGALRATEPPPRDLKFPTRLFLYYCRGCASVRFYHVFACDSPVDYKRNRRAIERDIAPHAIESKPGTPLSNYVTPRIALRVNVSTWQSPLRPVRGTRERTPIGQTRDKREKRMEKKEFPACLSHLHDFSLSVYCPRDCRLECASWWIGFVPSDVATRNPRGVKACVSQLENATFLRIIN